MLVVVYGAVIANIATKIAKNCMKIGSMPNRMMIIVINFKRGREFVARAALHNYRRLSSLASRGASVRKAVEYVDRFPSKIAKKIRRNGIIVRNSDRAKAENS